MTRKYTDSISNFERVAAELRSLRRERRMSQQTLADRAGVARRTITNAESAQNVGLHELCRIANALGYDFTLRPTDTVVFEDLDFFFGRDDQLRRPPLPVARRSTWNSSSIKSAVSTS